MDTLKWQRFRGAAAKANGNTINFQSELDCCTVTIQATNVAGYKLRLPVRFSKNINLKKGKLILQLSSGKRYNVQFFEQSSRLVLSGGWDSFAKQNDLKVGDVCAFELLPGMIFITLRVTIIRASDGVPVVYDAGYKESTRQSGHSNFQRPGSSTSNDLRELPHFFKIILENSEAMREKKLLIPRRFMRLYGHDMSAYVQVKDPKGRKWKLELLNCHGDTWFKNGWREFADYYSIVHGHVLVFKYEGNSQLSVVIFDKSATEITYPVARTHDFEENQEDFLNVEMEESDQDIEPEDENKDFNVRTKGLKADEKARAFEKAKAFKSKNPFFFIVMQPSYIDPISARLRLPLSLNIDLINKAKADAILYSNGRRWNVNYLTAGSKGKGKTYGATEGKEKAVVSVFGAGWKTFAEENSLEVGDVCVFELINITEVAFQVHIYRANENIDPSPSSWKRKQVGHEKAADEKPTKRIVELKKHKTSESADKFCSGNPFFRVIIKPHFLNSPYLDIPMDFVEKHFEQKMTDVLLLVDDRLWTVQFCPPGRFCSGWYKFVLDNSLQEREVIIFELIDRIRMVMKVHIRVF